MENKIKKRKYEVVIELNTGTREEAEKAIREKFVVVSIKCLKDFRSAQQNAALHVWFGQLADALVEKHFSVREILTAGVDVDWTPTLVKELMWRRIQVAMFGKKSTTQLFKSKEIDQIFDTIVRMIVGKTRGEVEVPPFPDRESFRKYE